MTLMDQAPLLLSISTAPDNGEAFWRNSADGRKLRLAIWKPKQNTRGTVLLFPGRGDYIELYGHPITSLTNAGYSALVIDWRGHGLSERLLENHKTGHVEQFSDYQLDVDVMIDTARSLELPEPWYLIAHSMGACIGLRALMNGLRVQAAAFSAPMFDIHMASYERPVALPITRLMSAVGMGHLYAPGFNDISYVLKNKFDGNNLTNSSEEYGRWNMQGAKFPELHIGGPSMRWLYAALKETNELSKLPSPQIPSIAFYGAQDQTVDISAIRARMENWPNGRIEAIANAKHELFVELPEVRDYVIHKTLEHFGQN